MCRTLPAALLLLALWATQPALAYLGGDDTSVEGDRGSLKAALRTTPTTRFDVHELTTDSGIVIREYSALGRVFAVSWQGFSMPDLQQLLGEYFTRYQQAVQARPRPGAHRSLSVSQPGLVVQSSGRMRDFHGIAYAPDLLPAGVNLTELQ